MRNGGVQKTIRDTKRKSKPDVPKVDEKTTENDPGTTRRETHYDVKAFRANEPQRFQQQPQAETFYDPTTFPPLPHVRQESGKYYEPSHVKFDTFGAAPRFVAANKEDGEVCPSGVEGGGVTVVDLGAANIETPPDYHSAMPTRSILKQSSINGQAPHDNPSYLETPTSFNCTKFFDEEIWSECPLQSYREQFPRQKENAFKGSKQEEQQIEQQDTDGTPANQWKPETSEEE
ncbi:GL26336 [Drosophila persimilis]|uniref:GL26336 n=1 Tax=Drosophila persimilis TaxID=7234 RepID=B4GT87_DROPE|nr:GL26336 [Drosophila persimilis]